MNNNENINWREIVAGYSSYEGTLGNFCNANEKYLVYLFEVPANSEIKEKDMLEKCMSWPDQLRVKATK